LQNAPGRVGPGTGVPKSTGYRVGYGTGVLTSTGYRFRDRDRTGTGGLVKKSGRDPTGSYTTPVANSFGKNAMMKALGICPTLLNSVDIGLSRVLDNLESDSVTEPWAATEAQPGAPQPALPRAGLPRLQTQFRLSLSHPEWRQKDPEFALTRTGWASRHGAPRGDPSPMAPSLTGAPRAPAGRP
jgi:hypothetical protein